MLTVGAWITWAHAAEVERLGQSSRRFGLEGGSGLGEEPVDERAHHGAGVRGQVVQDER